MMPSTSRSVKWTDALATPLEDLLGEAVNEDYVTTLCSSKQVADEVTKLLVRSSSGHPVGVILCSSEASPNLVARGTERARAAKKALGPELGRVILDPINEGCWEGLSYTFLPYRMPLSDSCLLWPAQRWQLKRPVLNWLRCVTDRTVRHVDRETALTAFVEPLWELSEAKAVSKRVRAAALRAATRARSGDWMPRHVLMHGDLWKGNLLADPEVGGFRVIDWPGSLVSGFALFDLVRLAQSFGLGRVGLRKEVQVHCRILECDIEDASSHLASALGNLRRTLEHFPVSRFASMADACLLQLEEAVA